MDNALRHPTEGTLSRGFPDLPVPLAEFRRKLARLLEITSRPSVSGPGSGTGLPAAERALLHKQYRFILQNFDAAVAQLPETQRSAKESVQ